MYFSDNLVLNTLSRLKFIDYVAIGAKYGIESYNISVSDVKRAILQAFSDNI